MEMFVCGIGGGVNCGGGGGSGGTGGGIVAVGGGGGGSIHNPLSPGTGWL